MGTHGVSVSQLGGLSRYNKVNYAKKTGVGQSSNKSTNRSSVIAAEYQFSKNLAVEYTSKDGDKLTFNMNATGYQKLIVGIKGGGHFKGETDLISYVNEQIAEMRNRFGKGLDEKNGQISDSEDSSGIPEYWNAENTSERIFQFSIAFASNFRGSDQEFVEKIKNAISDGFKQARDILGALPDSVNSLISDTFDLVMKKVDSWADARKPSDQGQEGAESRNV